MNSLKDFLTQNSYTFLQDAPMANFTTFRIGGPADFLVRVKTEEELARLAEFLSVNNIQYFMLGWGSNILVSDEGIRGVVIKNDIKKAEIIGEEGSGNSKKDELKSRFIQVDTKGRGLYEFGDLDYDESDSPTVKVKFSSGYDLPQAIKWSHENGLTGLQWYAGIPGTIGGAVFNNIHGGTHLFEEVVFDVNIIERETSKSKTLTKEDMKFSYDYSIIHDTSDIIISATLALFRGDVDRARFTADEWYRRKSVQPRNTPGCVWKNISKADKERLGFETDAIGYIIDQKLDWRGKKVYGNAIISQNHANFIENLGDATAHDVLMLMKQTKEEVKKRFDIDLESEIIFIGFKSLKLKEILEDIN